MRAHRITCSGGDGGQASEELMGCRINQDEHDRWMTAKATVGWTYGTPTDETARRHEGMVPWADLSDSQKDKDRALVADIPAILGRCGYAVIPIPP